MSQITLARSEWEKLKCPFETIKKFKTGYSIKCPLGTEIGWVSDEGKDKTILGHLKVRRDCGCHSCMANMELFLFDEKKRRDVDGKEESLP